jgi:4-amino-4-deoxy-L-arabinose transferase-like glycosyltransferase
MFMNKNNLREFVPVHRAARLIAPEQARYIILLSIVLFAFGLRSWNLGQLSFWYDEVVTMRLAEAPSPAALVHRLFEIDATRAPLHPLLLQAWIGLFGPSEAAARAFSVLCGVATVGLVYWIGRMVFDEMTGLWAAYLTALSPPLVYYSREARMYAWLVMLTCLCWAVLCSMRQAGRSRGIGRQAAYSLSLTALLYSHPLGLLMAVTLAVSSLPFAQETFGTRWGWLAAHLAPLLLVSGWLVNYFDHSPEFLSGRLPLKFLVGTPIGFIGGNFLVLTGLCSLIGFGLIRRCRKNCEASTRSGAVCLALWLIVPPALLYAYSLIGSPVFGPARYTLFVAPAFLILVAQGLVCLPLLTRLALGLALGLLAAASLGPSVYATSLKADWRALAKQIRLEARSFPEMKFRVVVQTTNPERNVEIETARYYLPEDCRVIPMEEFEGTQLADGFEGRTYVAIGIKEGADDPSPDDLRLIPDGRYPGLMVYRVGDLPPPRPPGRTPAERGGSDHD